VRQAASKTPRKNSKVTLLEVRSEFFHCCIFAGNLTSLSPVQSYLCADGASENSLINTAKRSRNESSQPTDPGRGMSVADNDAGAKDGEAGKTDVAHGVFLHTHYADIAKPAADGASYRRKHAKLGDPGVMARKGSDDAEFKAPQFFFAQRIDPEPTATQLTALTGPWLKTSRARAAVRSAKSAAPVSRMTLRTRDRAAMDFLVTITTSRHSGIARISETVAPPTCPVPPRITAAKFCFIIRPLLR